MIVNEDLMPKSHFDMTFYISVRLLDVNLGRLIEKYIANS